MNNNNNGRCSTLSNAGLCDSLISNLSFFLSHLSVFPTLHFSSFAPYFLKSPHLPMTLPPPTFPSSSYPTSVTSLSSLCKFLWCNQNGWWGTICWQCTCTHLRQLFFSHLGKKGVVFRRSCFTLPCLNDQSFMYTDIPPLWLQKKGQWLLSTIYSPLPCIGEKSGSMWILLGVQCNGCSWGAALQEDREPGEPQRTAAGRLLLEVRQCRLQWWTYGQCLPVHQEQWWDLFCLQLSLQRLCKWMNVYWWDENHTGLSNFTWKVSRNKCQSPPHFDYCGLDCSIFLKISTLSIHSYNCSDNYSH